MAPLLLETYTDIIKKTEAKLHGQKQLCRIGCGIMQPIASISSHNYIKSYSPTIIRGQCFEIVFLVFRQPPVLRKHDIWKDYVGVL